MWVGVAVFSSHILRNESVVYHATSADTSENKLPLHTRVLTLNILCILIYQSFDPLLSTVAWQEKLTPMTNDESCSARKCPCRIVNLPDE